ncbi:MAG: hypothetical protein D6732_29085 [Methanobacteriota archaeon]|nr:MAG: hypothetical protein D6732_29085 [Euryarchaeota archaeon]
MYASGTPLFARRYSSKLEQFDNTKTALLAGFLSAIDMFSKVNLEGTLKDIGFENERFFFEKVSEDIVLVVSTPDPYNDLMDQDAWKNEIIIKRILDRSRLALKVMMETASRLNIPVEDLIDDFGMTLDSLILESSYIESEENVIENYFEQTQEMSEKIGSFDEMVFKEAIQTIERYFGKKE